MTDVDFGALKLKKILVKNGLLKCGKLVGFSLFRAGLCTTYKLIPIIYLSKMLLVVPKIVMKSKNNFRL